MGINRDQVRRNVYFRWRNILKRCYDKRCPAYRFYGARGVTVFKKWKTDFDAFYAHIGPPPTIKHTIDRIKNNKGYEPGNLRWSTRVEQMANNSQAKHVEIDGVSHPIKHWCRILGIPYQRVKDRVRRGMSHKEALTAKKQAPRERIIEFRGQKKNLSQWGRDVGISAAAMLNRIKNGWPIELALTTPSGGISGYRTREIQRTSPVLSRTRKGNS